MTLHETYPLTLVFSVLQANPQDLGLSILCPPLCPGRLIHIGYTVAPSVTGTGGQSVPHTHLSLISTSEVHLPLLRPLLDSRDMPLRPSLLMDDSNFPLLLGCLSSPGFPNPDQTCGKELFMTVPTASKPRRLVFCRVSWQPFSG